QEPFVALVFYVGLECDMLRDHPGWRRPPLRGFRCVQAMNKIAPDRRGAGDAGYVVHGSAREIADPDADGVARCEADAPVVAHVLAGPRFGRAPDARCQRILQPEA